MMSRLVLAIAASTALSACFSVLPDPAPAPSVYRLASTAQPVEKNASAEIVKIDRPTAPSIMNSTDIIVIQGNQKLSAVAKAQWSETTPMIIQNSMLDALEGSPKFIGVVPSSGTRAATRLHVTVKSFEANFDNGPENAPLAVVEYRVTYARSEDRALLGTHMVRNTARAASINVSSIVTAIEQANKASTADIVDWLERQ